MERIETAAGGVSQRRLVSLLCGAVLVAALSQTSGLWLTTPLASAFVPAGFALMGVLARLSDREPSARLPVMVLLAAVTCSMSMGSLALVVLNVVEPNSLREPPQEVEFVTGGEARLSFMILLLAVGGSAAALSLFRMIRGALTDIIPIDPEVTSHAIGLSAAITVALVPLLPLLVLGRPPFPVPAGSFPADASGLAMPSFEDRALEMAWYALATFIIAGAGSGRSTSALVTRLGLKRPPWWHLAGAAGIGLLMAIVRPFVAAHIAAWMGTPPVDSRLDGWSPPLMAWPALVACVVLTASGTELTYRGLLQPRLGLIFTTLVWVAPFAWMASWDVLFVAFGAGLAFGALRLVSGTAAAWTAHVVFLLAWRWTG